MIELWIIGFLCLWIYVSFNWYGWKIDLELWEMKRNKNKEKVTRKSYKTVDELWEDLDRPVIWYKDLYLTIRVRIEQFFDVPRDVYRYFKRGIQRWNRGWSDADIWGVNDFLSRVIPAMLKRLKETQQGLPTWTEDKTEEQAQKEWNDILDTIINTFETSKKIADNELGYFENWSQRKYDYYNKIWVTHTYEPKPRAMTKEECGKYKQGWELFRKYYFSLWD